MIAIRLLANRLAPITPLSVLAIFTTDIALARAELSYPLTSDKVEQFLNETTNPTIESLLSKLPKELNENFVLMHQSRSMHRATPLSPRQILFGSDARFIVATSGNLDDARFNSMEFAEFNPTDGNYHFGTIEFADGKAKVERDVGFCKNCHGTPTRPLWGQYPNWMGAYGDTHGDIEGSLREDFKTFIASIPSTPRFQSLKFGPGASEGKFLLPTRYYPYPNTNFNHELGNTVAIGTATKLRNHPNYQSYKSLYLAANPTLGCIDSDAWFDISAKVNRAYKDIEANYLATNRVDVKAMRLLGIDPVFALSLDKFARAPGNGGSWQTGAFKIDEAIAMQLLNDAIAEQEELADLFEPQKTTIDSIMNYASLLGLERGNALRKSSAWFLFFDVFDPITENKAKLNTLCSKLAG